MLTNAGSLVGTAAVNLPLGFVFWWLAAHRFPTAAVGVAAASVSTMLLLSAVSVLGLGTLLIGELPRRPGKAPTLVASALVVVGLVGFALGLVFARVAPTASDEFAPLAASMWTTTLFASGVALTTMALLLDQAVIGALRGNLQFGRNALVAVLKLAILWLLASYTADESPLLIYGAWTAGTLISLVLLAVVFLSEGSRPRDWRPDWQLMRSLKNAAWWHHEVNLALQVPTYAMPVIATVLLSSTKGAYFYASWMIAGLVFVVPASLGMVLYAVTAARPGALASLVKRTMAHSFVAACAVGGIVWVAGPWVLGLFGKEYESHAGLALRILILAVVPLIVRYQYIAISRVFGTLRRAGLFVAIASLLELAAAIGGGRVGGLVGLSAAWVGVVCLEAVLMGSVVYRVASTRLLVDPDRASQSTNRHPVGSGTRPADR
jgi:O-antigen/teichoic acid export membrane protein